jgi:hypothetical protein
MLARLDHSPLCPQSYNTQNYSGGIIYRIIFSDIFYVVTHGWTVLKEFNEMK